MIKKHSILSFLLLAYTIVLVHGIVPHHHHDDEDHETELAAHDHHAGHDNDQDPDDDLLSHSFGHYTHISTDTEVSYNAGTKIFYNDSPVFIASVFLFHINETETARLPVLRHQNDHIPVLRRSLAPKGLRAPPFNMA